MSYEITDGISEYELASWLNKAAGRYGTFKDGRINYKDATLAPIVMCTIICGDKILLAKRGYGLADAEGYWSTINGFIDELKPVKEQAKQEVREELGLSVESSQIRVGKSYTLTNPKEKRRYIVFPCLVTVSEKPDIVLNHEHTEFAWVHRNKLEKYEMLDDLPYVINSALATQLKSTS